MRTNLRLCVVSYTVPFLYADFNIAADLKKRETLSEIKEAQSLEKLKDFIESDLTDHRKLQQNMTKHVNICDELTKLVTSRKCVFGFFPPPFFLFLRQS